VTNRFRLNSSRGKLFDAGESRLELGYQQTFAPAGSEGANDSGRYPRQSPDRRHNGANWDRRLG
jgi:hypothetical protein